jgi:hypothetical protein
MPEATPSAALAALDSCTIAELHRVLGDLCYETPGQVVRSVARVRKRSQDEARRAVEAALPGARGPLAVVRPALEPAESAGQDDDTPEAKGLQALPGL